MNYPLYNAYIPHREVSSMTTKCGRVFRALRAAATNKLSAMKSTQSNMKKSPCWTALSFQVYTFTWWHIVTSLRLSDTY